MKKSSLTEEQIIRILKEGEAGGKIDKLCRCHNISKPTYYNWKSKYGGKSGNFQQHLTTVTFASARDKIASQGKEL